MIYELDCEPELIRELEIGSSVVLTIPFGSKRSVDKFEFIYLGASRITGYLLFMCSNVPDDHQLSNNKIYDSFDIKDLKEDLPEIEKSSLDLINYLIKSDVIDIKDLFNVDRLIREMKLGKIIDRINRNTK